jgi:hypothetical protein
VEEMVFGGEAAGSYLWLRNSHGDLSTVGDLFGISTSFKTHYLFTVGPRVGYTWGCWMPYITGGLAVGDMEYSQNIRMIPPGPGLGTLEKATTTLKRKPDG